jgi:hypothetical protein
VTTINDIAQSLVSRSRNLMKVVSYLSQKRYLYTTRGRNGGIRLMREPRHIWRSALSSATGFTRSMHNRGGAMTSPASLLVVFGRDGRKVLLEGRGKSREASAQRPPRSRSVGSFGAPIFRISDRLNPAMRLRDDMRAMQNSVVTRQALLHDKYLLDMNVLAGAASTAKSARDRSDRGTLEPR